MTIRLMLLDTPRLLIDDTPYHFERHKALALLAYLGITRRPYTRDYLATLLWPDHASSRVQLRAVLSTLRAALGEAGIDAGRDRIALPDHVLVCDVTDTLEQLDHLERFPDEAQPAQLEQLGNLCAAGFMRGFSLRDAPAFDLWQQQQDEAIRERAVRAMLSIVNLWAAAGRDEDVLRIARCAAHIDPWHEGARRLILSAAAWMNRPALAMQEFRLFETLLRDQLDVAPDVETQQLAAAIAAGQPVHRPSPARKTVHHFALPALPPLIGRQALLGHIIHLAQQAGARLITLIGAGGLGKTHLAIAAAAQLASHFQDGAVLLRLESETSPEHLATMLLNALHIERASLHSTSLDTLVGRGQTLHMVVVLDNAHWLSGAADFLSRLHQAAPGVCLIATSYDPLEVSFEYRVLVSGLSWEGGTAESPSPAVAWFAHCAARTSTNFQLTSETLPAIQRICARAGGFPLAIMLAASWCDMFTPDEIEARMAATADFLQSTHHDLPERQRSMRAIFETAWSRLTPELQHALCALSIFEGSFSPEAALHAAGVTPEMLRGLIARAFVTLENDALRLHDLFRQYAWDKLSSEARRHLAHAHLTFYLQSLVRLTTQITGMHPRHSWDSFDANIENVAAAWLYGCENEEFDLIGQMIEPFRVALQTRGFWDRGVALFDVLRRTAARSSHPRARLLFAQAHARMYHHDAGSEARLRMALSIAHEYDDADEIANVQAELGWLAITQQQMQIAHHYFENAYSHYAAQSRVYYQALMLRGLAYAAIGMHDHALARGYTSRSLLLRRAIGDWVGEQESLILRGELALVEGDLPSAHHDLYAAYSVFMAHFSPAFAIRRTWSLGWVCAFTLELDWVRDYIAQVNTLDESTPFSLIRCNADALALLSRTLQRQVHIIPAEVEMLEIRIRDMLVLYSTINPDLRFFLFLTCWNAWNTIGRFDRALLLLNTLDEQGYLNNLYADWLLPGALITAYHLVPHHVSVIGAALAAVPIASHPWLQAWAAFDEIQAVIQTADNSLLPGDALRHLLSFIPST